MGITSDDVRGHLQTLAGEIGNRLIGTPGNQAAAAYIAGQFRSTGLEVSNQEFPCPDWAAESARLKIEDLALEAWANTFSPACDLQAEIIPIGTFSKLQTADISGKIPVFYGELAQHELAAKQAIYVPERDRVIVQILDKRSPSALITVNPTLNAHWRLVEDFDLHLPSVTVSARSGLELMKRAGQTVHLRINAHRKPSSSANVIGRVLGTVLARIVLCAHYDTKEDTAGAYDNACGVAALLATIPQLMKQETHHSVEWIAFSGEEGYGLGDMLYAQQTGEAGFKEVVAAINLDGVGPILAVNTIATFAASEAFEAMVNQIALKYPGVARVDPWAASDHYIFYSHGVPSVAIGSVGIRDIYHTPDDSLAWVSPERVAEAANLAVEIARAVDQSDTRRTQVWRGEADKPG